MDESTQDLAATFEQALADRPAPTPPPTEWIEGSHKFFVAQTEELRDQKIDELRAAGVKVLDYKKKFGVIWIIKTMAPRV